MISPKFIYLIEKIPAWYHMKQLFSLFFCTSWMLSFSQVMDAPWPPYSERKLEDFEQIIVEGDTCYLLKGLHTPYGLGFTAEDVPTGTWVAFYDSAKTKMTFKFSSTRGIGLTGKCEAWFSDGSRHRIGYFSNGFAISDSMFWNNGNLWGTVHLDSVQQLYVYNDYHPDTEKLTYRAYRNSKGQLVGLVKSWDKNGNLTIERLYDNGVLIEEKLYN